MVGYRIPTENKSSMLPLIVKGFLPQQNGSAIMLPADITWIAGSDFDVDKMFLRIPMYDKAYYRKTGKVRKLEYDISKEEDNNIGDATSEGKMTKEQRDNLMIDIEFAVLTSKEGSELLYYPSNFEELKRESALAGILANRDVRASFVRRFGN